MSIKYTKSSGGLKIPRWRASSLMACGGLLRRCMLCVVQVHGSTIPRVDAKNLHQNTSRSHDEKYSKLHQDV